MNAEATLLNASADSVTIPDKTELIKGIGTKYVRQIMNPNSFNTHMMHIIELSFDLGCKNVLISKKKIGEDSKFLTEIVTKDYSISETTDGKYFVIKQSFGETIQYSESENGNSKLRKKVLSVLSENDIRLQGRSLDNPGFQLIMPTKMENIMFLDALEFHVEGQDLKFDILFDDVNEIVIDKLPWQLIHKRTINKEYRFNRLFYSFIPSMLIMGCKKIVVPREAINVNRLPADLLQMYGEMFSIFHFLPDAEGNYTLLSNGKDTIEYILKLEDKIERLYKESNSPID
jgi:hypothetical protein